MWEYMKMTSYTQLTVEELNDLGCQDGWELVTIIVHPNSNDFKYVHFFKRPKV